MTDRRPKRLKVPEVNEDLWTTLSAYEWDWDSLYQTTQARRRRPFPASNTLASLPRNYTAADIPLIRNVLPCQPLQPQQQLQLQLQSAVERDNPNSKSSVSTSTIDDVSTLTVGQHKRYLELQHNNKGSWNNLKRKEWKQLREVVSKEQQLYRKAVQEFLIAHRNRYLVGFQATAQSPFACWHADHVKRFIQQWNTSKETQNKFGKCRQVVSLLQGWNQPPKLSPSDLFDSLPIGTIAHDDTGDNTDRAHINEGDTINPPQIPSVPHFLVDNTITLLQLATQHGASIVTTQETLRALIGGKKWQIPMTKTSECCLLDVPLPRPCTTRECLTNGMQDSIHIQKSSYSYTLLTLKATRKPLHVLVRVNHTRGPSTHVHLEYFQERGWERLTTQERAKWILDDLMGCQSQVARACPKTSKVLRVDPGGVAHALAQDQEPMRHLQVMAELLSATESMPDGNLLLALDGSDVRVHRANDGEPEIDLDVTFIQLDAVYTGASALDECAQEWEWDQHDRVPNTFPIK